jgi:hypothetical protein
MKINHMREPLLTATIQELIARIETLEAGA